MTVSFALVGLPCKCKKRLKLSNLSVLIEEVCVSKDLALERAATSQPQTHMGMHRLKAVFLCSHGACAWM